MKIAAGAAALALCACASSGTRLWKMLSLGASRPDALEVMTGQRQMGGSALLACSRPLQAWLRQQNQGQKCGW